MRTTTIDLRVEIEDLEEEIEETEQAQDELVAQFDEEYDGYSEVPQEDRNAYNKLDEKLVEDRGLRDTLERCCEEWNGSQFEIRELSTGDLAEIQDAVSEASFEFDAEEGDLDGVPKEGYGMIESLRHAIVSQPRDAPTSTAPGGARPEPAEYPHQVGTFLFEKVNMFNAVGDTDLGNSSLRDRMES